MYKKTVEASWNTDENKIMIPHSKANIIYNVFTILYKLYLKSIYIYTRETHCVGMCDSAKDPEKDSFSHSHIHTSAPTLPTNTRFRRHRHRGVTVQDEELDCLLWSQEDTDTLTHTTTPHRPLTDPYIRAIQTEQTRTHTHTRKVKCIIIEFIELNEAIKWNYLNWLTDYDYY